ncbi:MAG: hypothetical protein KKE86_09595 [Planctomycetes bacterium]|nr:hypothetical protein [Planctomycetota bacterium]
MNKKPSNTPAPLDEELVAYLDGELDAENGRRVETLLATDPKLRRRLQSLERTWDLLDELDTAPVGEPFTHTTLEMVALAGREDVEREKSEAPRRRRRRRMTFSVCFFAAAAAGFAAVAMFVPDTDRQLLEDLPVLERFDEYRHVESVEFLRLLRDEGLFSEKDADPPEADLDYSPAERHRRVAGMDSDEKELLRLVEERFNNLTPNERQRMRQLLEALRNDADADRLQAIMQRYCDWLKTLSSYSRASLAELDPKDRVQWIKKRLRLERLRKNGGRLDGDDLMKLREWVVEHAAKYQKQYLESLSETQRKRLSELNPRTRRRVVFEQMLQQWRADDSKIPLPMMNDEEMKLLRERLSPRAKKRLEAVPPAMQWKMAAGWLWQGMRRPGSFKDPHSAPTKDDDERLARFFEKELSGEQRDRLLGMSVEDMQRELHRLFLMRARSLKGPHRRP